MTEEQIKQLILLIEQWTRAEIMARLAQFNNFEAANYFDIKIKKENEIRKLLFDTDDLVKLGLKWNLLKEEKEQVKQTKILLFEQYKKLQKQLEAMEKEL